MIGKLIHGLTSVKWQALTGLATVAALGLSVALMIEKVESRHQRKLATNYYALIHDKNTGYIAQLAQMRSNLAALQGSLDQQSAAVRKISAESEARLADAAQKLVAAQQATKRAESRVAVLLSNPPRGNTLEARILDVDARVMEAVQ